MLDYINELDADFRVFYRFPERPDAPGIADEHFGSFSGPQFLRLAWRTPSYQGAVAAKALAEKEKAEKEKKANGPRTLQAKGTPYTEISLEQLQAEDSDLIEYEKA